VKAEEGFNWVIHHTWLVQRISLGPHSTIYRNWLSTTRPYF